MAGPGENDDESEESGAVGGKKKLVVIIGAIIALLGVGAGLYFSGVLGKKAGEEAEAKLPSVEQATKAGKGGAVAAGPIYLELPDFLVNLNTAGTKTSFLKMKVTLELNSQASLLVVETAKPRIVDACVTYLRELRKSDLVGSAGIHRLREELLLRVNKAIEPEQVKDILFGEIIVQ